MAEAWGKKLLGEVQEVGFGEILHELLRIANGTSDIEIGVKHIDRFLKTFIEARSTTAKSKAATQPLIEIHSLAPGNGSTHLLYYITAIATLPQHLGGHQAAVAFIDTDSSYSVQRQAQVIKGIIGRHTQVSDQAIEDVIVTALSHIHVFKPQSLHSLIATVQALPTYLLDGSKHASLDRSLAFIAIDSASAFYWQEKAETEDAAFLASTEGPRPQQPAPSAPPGYAQLAKTLETTCTTLNCPAITTTHQLTNLPARSTHDQQHYTAQDHQDLSSLRPQIPAQNPTLRLITRRLPVRRFPPGISFESAAREAENRQKAVEEGKFECVVNLWDVDARTLGMVQRGGGEGFGFWVGGEGVEFEGQ